MCESWEYQSPAIVVGKWRIRVAILWGRLLVGGRIIDGYNKLVWGIPLIYLLKNNFSTYKVLNREDNKKLMFILFAA